MNYNSPFPDLKDIFPNEMEGNTKKLASSDSEARDVLVDILKELKKINLHLSIMTDIHLKNQDVEGDVNG